MDENTFYQLQILFLQKYPRLNAKLEESVLENISKFAISFDEDYFHSIFTDNNDEAFKETLNSNNKNVEHQSKNLLNKQEKIVNNFSLNINDRSQLLTILKINSDKINTSQTNQLYYSILLLQSFASLFFINLDGATQDNSNNTLTINELNLFIQSLSLSIQLNPPFFEIAYRSFSIFYIKFSQTDSFSDEILNILNCTNCFIQSVKKIPSFFFPILVKVSSNILHFAEKISNQEEEEKNSKFIEHFEKISIILAGQESIKDPKVIFSDDEIENIIQFFTKSANFSTFFNFNELSQSIVKFCLQISFCTGIKFKQIIPLFENVIQQNEFNEKDGFEINFINIVDFASKSISIFDSEIFNQKFEPLLNILQQISNKSTVVSIVFSMTIENIFNGNLDDFLFLLLFVHRKIIDDSIMIEFLTKPLTVSDQKTVDYFSILIPDSIYQKTIFDDNCNRYLLLLKSVGVKLYQNFAKVKLKLYRSFFELLDRLKEHEKDFTELLIISFSILSDNYLTDIDFFKTFRIAFNNMKDTECINATLDFLNDIFNSGTFLYSALDSFESNLLFCQLLNNPSYEKVGQQFFQKLFVFLGETPQKAPNFEYLYQAVEQTTEKTNFFKLFYDIINSLKKSILKLILKETIFKLIQETIANCSQEKEIIICDECFDAMFKLLELYYHESITKYKINWELISSKINETRKGRLTQSMYHSILSILSGIKEYEGYREPTPLIKVILPSEEYSKDFIKKLYHSITNNSVQLLAFHQAGIITILLDFTIDLISNHSSLSECEINDLFDIIMKVVVLVNNFVCDRETLEKFLSVFDHLDLKSKANRGRMSRFLKYFEESMNENSLSPSYALRFDSLTSSILLPSLPNDCFSLGFTLVVNLLIPRFRSMMCLISFISQNSFLCVYIGQKKIVISSNHYSKPIIFKVKIPKNEWFDLKIHFRSLGEVIIQLNNDKLIEDSSQASCQPFPQTIETAVMLKATVLESKFQNVEGILTKIMIYIGPLKNKIVATDINDPSLYALYSPRFTDSENHLKNLAYNYSPPKMGSQDNLQLESSMNSSYSFENNKDAVYCANCQRYLPTFRNVFMSFSGLSDFILFFSHEGLDVKLINDLIETLKFLLKDSTELQNKMLEINGFYLTTYFIKDIKPSNLSVEFWESIIEFEKIITNVELMKNFFDALVLSFKPYLESDETVLFQVMNKWSKIEPSFFISCITFPLFCQIIYHQFHDRKVSNSIKALLIQIIVNVSRLFGQKEMMLLCQMIVKMSVDDYKSALTMFQAIRAITTSYPNLHDIAINIMLMDDQLMRSKHPEIVCAVLQLFAQRNLTYLALLLKTQIAIQREYSEINHFLTHFCGVFVGKSFKSLEDINEVELSDHTIYLPILDFILSFSFQTSSNQIEKITNFLIKIFNDQVCIQYIAVSINPITLFLLISFAIVLSNNLVHYLVDIISLNIKLFADAYQIIDILSNELNSNFHDYQTTIACSVLMKVIELDNNKKKNLANQQNDDINQNIDIPKLIDAVVNSICFGINRSVFEFTNCGSIFFSKENERKVTYLTKPSGLSKIKGTFNNASLPNIRIMKNSITDDTESTTDNSDQNPGSSNSTPNNSYNGKYNGIPSLNSTFVNVSSDISNSETEDPIEKEDSETANSETANSETITPLSGESAFPHSVSFDLLPSPTRDRISGLFHQQSPHLFYSLSFFIKKKFVLNQIFDSLKTNALKNKPKSFGLIYKNIETWSDKKITDLMLSFLSDTSLPQESFAQLCILLFFTCHKQIFSSKKISYMLNLVAERCEIGTPFIWPILNEVTLHIDDFKEARLFLKKFESVLSPSIKLYEESTNFMRRFIESLHPISNIGEKLSQLFSFEMKEPEFMDIDSYFLDLKQKELTKNNLRERMYRKLRPIYTDSMRRFNLIDNHFRPFLLTNSQQLNLQILDSPSVQDNFAQSIVWSAKCVRVKLYTKIPGLFIITKDGIRFSTTKGKSLFILKTSVRCIFWNYYHHLPNSFTFTTLKGKTFLFRFITQITNEDDEDENENEEKEKEKFGNERKIYLSDGDSTIVYKQTATRDEVVSNLKQIEMKNCVFFQDTEPSLEIGRLCLTQQWRRREISNFDYILWLNMLSGRSFLDIECYPIFPLLFISDTDQSLFRDLSKNVSLSLSKDNNQKLRERKYSDFDPYSSFLFSKASSTPELTKRLLYSIEQFRIGDNKVNIIEDNSNQSINSNSNLDNKTQNENINISNDASNNNSQLSNRDENDDKQTIIEKEKENLLENEQNENENAININNNNSNNQNTNENENSNDKNEKNLELKISSSGSISSQISLNSFRNEDKTKSVFKPFTSYSEILNEITEGTLQCELPPEFFFMPEIFSNWTSFPKYAPNASTFVMKNLEALESEEVSLNIHKWIDMIWGVNQNHDTIFDPDLSSTVWNLKKSQKNNEKQKDQIEKHTKKRWLKNSLNETKPADSRSKAKTSDESIERNKIIHHKLSSNGQIPTRLFVGPHPARGTCNKKQAKHTSFTLSTETKARTIGVTIMNKKIDDVEIFIFHENEKITRISCSLNKTLTGISIPYDFHHFEHVLFSNSFLIYVLVGTKTLFGYDFERREFVKSSESPHLMGITCIDASTSASYFASGSSDSSIVTWTVADDPQVSQYYPPRNLFNGAFNPFTGKLFECVCSRRKIVPFRTLTAHRKPIARIKIHDEMRIIAAIDDAGVISISVFPYLNLIKTIDTEIDDCKQLVITRNSIICFKGNVAVNFTANGTKNTTRKFNYEILCAESIESRTRTDVVAISTSQNEIVTINSVSLTAISILEHQRSRITEMKYKHELDALVCYTEGKKVLIIPIAD